MATFKEFAANCDKICFFTSTRNFTICDEIKYFDCWKYPKIIIDGQYLVPATVLLTCIFVSGLLGNLSVCYVIAKHPGMRTETNIYLFSLAVSDLLLLIFGMPPELSHYWQMYPYILGNFMCRFNTFMAATGTWASILTVVAFSIERYEAVCRPLHSRWLGDKRVAITICAIWTVSALTSLPIWYVYKVVMETYPGTGKKSLYSRSCTVPNDKDYDPFFYSHIVTTVVFFFIPMVILAVVYIKIACTLTSNRRLSRDCGIQNNCSENRRIFKVLVAVVLAFFICGAPFHYQRVFASSGKNRSMEALNRDRIVLVATGVFFYFSATVNPIIYNAMSKRYRKAFMDTIWTKAAQKKRNDSTPMNVTRDNETSSKTTDTFSTTLIK